MTTLRGMTWNHTRGYLPMVATAQRFTEIHPDIEIVWEKRSLKAFEEFPVEKLAADYDLMVIDHPFSGSWYPHAFISTMADVMRFADGETTTLPTHVEDAFKTMATVEATYLSSTSGATPIPT